MGTNQYFNKFAATNEQTLVQDLVDETIRIHGVDMVYIPRTRQNEDEVLGDANLPLFEDAREVEMYVEIWPQFDRYLGGQFLNNKKDRLGNLSLTWIIRVGAIGFEPTT